MNLPLVFRAAAQAEFDEAAVWYEGRKPGLGNDFVAEVQQILDTITDHPERYSLVFDDVREALVSRFPYCICYRVKSDRIVVIAVFPTSRSPSVWQERA